MKKIIGIALILAVIGTMGFGGVALAAPGDPIDVDVTWSGGGTVGGTVVAGTTVATTTWQSIGNGISGTFTANYNVGGAQFGASPGNSYSTSMDASALDGIIEFSTLRGAFGYTNGGALELGGQQSYSFIGTGSYDYTDPNNPVWVPGTGNVSMKTRTSAGAPYNPHSGGFSGLGDHTYGWTSSNFDANGAYTIIRRMTASDNDFVQATAVGSGTADLDCGHAYASGDAATLARRSGYNFGWNQDFSATSTGVFDLLGVGQNQVTFYDISNTNSAPGPGCSFGGQGIISITPDGKGLTATNAGAGAALQIIADFNNGLTCPNWGMTAK